MASYIVVYDLHRSGQNYDDLIEAIKSYGTWCHLQQSVWVIVTQESSVTIRDKLCKHLDSNDKLFVAKLEGEGAWIGHGDKVSEWLKKNL